VLPIADRAPALSLGSVAIQTYSGTVLVRSAAGVVVASDGLIVTTATAAPYGATGGYLYQVTTSDGAVARARRVAYDAANGLVLLKAETTELGTVPFTSQAVHAGDELTAIGATVLLSRYAPVIVPAAVVYAADERQVAISLDRTYMTMLQGARLVDGQGRTLGLLRQGATAGIIPASVINAFVGRYLK
jgi:S1-C subfamily serine protease